MEVSHSHTCIVAELDDGTCRWVKAARQKLDCRYKDMPVEVSLCGSGGLGPLSKGQRLETVRYELEQALTRFVSLFKDDILSFHFLRKVKTFPGTQIHVLQPSRPNIFTLLQKELRNSKLRFEEARFEFIPHCTLYNGTFLEKFLDESEITQRRAEVQRFVEDELDVRSETESRVINLAVYECALSYPAGIHLKQLLNVQVPWNKT